MKFDTTAFFLPLWKCPDCGYEWNSTISSRLDRKEGKIIVRQCQNCYYNDPSRITPVASMPKLMRFWDFKENNMVLIQIWFLHILLYRQIGTVKNVIIVAMPLSGAGQEHQMPVHFVIPIT